MTREQFIEKAKKVHGNKYDYSKVEYKGSLIKVCIICPEHGEFWQTPNSHLCGSECRMCSYKKRSDKKKSNTEDFIKKAHEIHGDRYDYSKVEYVNNRTKVCIICPEHGEFWQSPDKHLTGQGCPRCGGTKRLTTEDFIKKAHEIHGNKYDYSKVNYINNHTKVCIICPEHGEFWQTPKDHLNKQECSKCGHRSGGEKQTSNTEEFIQKSKNIHGNKYDYSKVDYINNHIKVCIVCPEHGEFWQTPKDHLLNKNCPKCSNVYKPTTHEWILKAEKVHDNKYDYSKIDYINTKTKVCIICPEHGEFWQLPYAHLQGQGCPSCDMSHLENDIYSILKKYKIKFINESDLDGKMGRMRVDFYLPELNIVIECQGGQHFYPGFDRRNKQHAEDIHNKVVKRDLRKRKILDDNKIKIIYYCNESDYNEKILNSDEFEGLYTIDNLFYKKSDIELSITPAGVQWA